MVQIYEEYSQGPKVAVAGVVDSVSINSCKVGCRIAVDSVSPGEEVGVTLLCFGLKLNQI